ncbi:hypothetical protein NEOLI_004441 [Neolecta irregularis DAH-3]|uniref:Uncharacterized protein n=1 Tax=Neolecta irregularis (strain DAH-3) TaxID=1198029 RepID=A0A1U7LLR3_NEOID|nr:hypothetical protein NEOLI_004441 [Neolecta irregularis DAH-3]|eukprot:OLL23600.1 hypothetical protein NEOLI_004441 [Neolecta irregularis DAH-3]
MSQQQQPWQLPPSSSTLGSSMRAARPAPIYAPAPVYLQSPRQAIPSTSLAQVGTALYPARVVKCHLILAGPTGSLADNQHLKPPSPVLSKNHGYVSDLAPTPALICQEQFSLQHTRASSKPMPLDLPPLEYLYCLLNYDPSMSPTIEELPTPPSSPTEMGPLVFGHPMVSHPSRTIPRILIPFRPLTPPNSLL